MQFDFADALKFVASSLPYKLPVLAVLAGGLIYCAINYSRFPAANRKVLGGLLLLLAVEFLGIFTPLLQIYAFRNFDNQTAAAYLTFAVGFVLAVVSAAGLGLILWAVWANRQPA